MAENEVEVTPTTTAPTDPEVLSSRSQIAANERRRVSEALQGVLTTTQGKTVASGVTTVVIVLAMLFFAISPALATITRQSELNTQLAARNQQLQRKQDVLFGLIGKESSSAELVRLFDNLLGGSKQQETIYTELNKLTNDAGLTFRAVDFGAELSGEARYVQLDSALNPRLKLQRVQLVVTGTKDQVVDLSKLLEETTRIYDIESVSYSVVQAVDGKSGDQFDATFQLITLYWQEGTL